MDVISRSHSTLGINTKSEAMQQRENLEPAAAAGTGHAGNTPVSVCSKRRVNFARHPFDAKVDEK